MGLFWSGRGELDWNGLFSGLAVDLGALLHRDSTFLDGEVKMKIGEFPFWDASAPQVFALSREITNSGLLIGAITTLDCIAIILIIFYF